MATLIDSCSETNYYTYAICRANGYSSWGQSFNNVNAGTLASCKFFLSKSGSPTGTVIAKIYAHTGTYGSSSLPTEAALATSDTINASALPTDNALITFTFTGSNQIALSASTYYIVQITCSGGDASNYVKVGMCENDSKHTGNSCRYWGGWYTFSQDAIFYVYGSEAVVRVPRAPAALDCLMVY